MKIILKLYTVARSLVLSARKAADIRDLFVFGGLALLGYGLWLYAPWLGFAVAGALLMTIG